MAEKKSDLLEQRKQDLVNAKLDGDARKEMFAYKNLGEAYNEVDDTKKAIDNFIHSLRIAQQEHDRAYEGEVSCDLGNAYFILEDYKQATTHFNKCLIIYKELSDRAEEKNANHYLGHCYVCTANYKEAIEHFNKYLIISKELGDRYEEGRANNDLSQCYAALSDYKQAVEHLNKCLIICKELGDRVREKIANHNLGHCYMRMANYKEAVEHINKYLIISKELGDRYGEGRANNGLGLCYYALRDHKQAIEHSNKYLIISKELGDRYGEGSANHDLGQCYYALSDYKQAVEHCNKYLIISKELVDRDGEARANNNLGHYYCELSDYKQAIQHIEQSLIIAKNNGNRDMEGIARHYFGVIYARLGDYEKAIEYFKQKRDIAIGAGDRDGELAAYGNLGSFYNNIGKFSKAKEYYDIKLAIAKELKNKDAEANSYFGLGRAYLKRGYFMKAIEFFCQFLNIDERKELRMSEGCAYTRLGEAYLGLNNFKEAGNYGMKGLAIAKEKGKEDCERRANYILGRTMECFNFLHEALDHYRSALKISNGERDIIKAEDAHKISFRNSHQPLYVATCRTLLKLSNFGEALCVVDQGRAQVLLDYTKQKYQMEFPPPRTSEPDLAPLVSTQTIFISLEKETINMWLVSNGNDIQFRQKEANHDYKFGNDPCPCCLKCLKKAAFKENEFAARVFCEDRSMDALRPDLWEQDEDSCHEMSALLSEDSFRLDVPREESPLDKETCHEMLKSPQSQRNSLRLLYDAVIGPIANELKGDELLIIPDGLLGLVPFAAFVDKDSKYLSETFKIRTAPSLTTLKLINDCPENYHCKSGALLVGNPCFEEITDLLGKPWFQPLPHAEKEVQMIGEIINATPLVGKEATKDEVLKRIASVALVHIATHGSAETGDICLAPNPSRKYRKPEKEDYMLKMSDIKALKLRARLVVLSCCHSGRGDVSAEGVVGIAWALLASGARSVLASLWAIGDEATMEFMKTFYKHLRDGDNASTALHKAMKCLRESEKFSAPKNWAPFVIIGDDVTLEFEEDIEQC